MAKRYYWLKIQESFFKQKEIKILRKMENGSTCVIIYQKMLLAALENDNLLYFDHLQDSFEEEIAVLLDEKVEDVKVTVDFLRKTNLIKCENKDEYILTEIENLTGKESDSKNRVRKHRENKKNLKAEENSCNVTCNENVTLDIEKELDKELEKETDIPSKSMLEKTSSDTCDEKKSVSESVDENLAKIIKLYEENIGLVYPADREYFIEISNTIHWSLFKKAVQICIDKNKVNPAYLKGILKKWSDEKICTLDEWKRSEEEFLSKKQSRDTSHSKSDSTKSKSVKNKSKKKSQTDEIDENMLKEIAAMEEKLGVS